MNEAYQRSSEAELELHTLRMEHQDNIINLCEERDQLRRRVEELERKLRLSRYSTAQYKEALRSYQKGAVLEYYRQKDKKAEARIRELESERDAAFDLAQELLDYINWRSVHLELLGPDLDMEAERLMQLNVKANALKRGPKEVA